MTIRSLLDRYFIKQPRLRRWVTRVLYGDQDTEVTLFGCRFTINSLRENGYLRASRKITHSSLLRDEIATLLSLAGLLQPGDTFVDVGANIGLFSCTLARRTRFHAPGALRFYAYEPHPDTFRRLARNAAAAGVVARNFAVSNMAGSLEFVDGAVSHVFTRVEQANAYNLPDQRLSIPSVRLDQETIEGNSLVIKVDVEGSEWGVLQGAVGLFAAGRVKAVYLDGYEDKPAIEAFLRKHGFTFWDMLTLERVDTSHFGLLALRAGSGSGY